MLENLLDLSAQYMPHGGCYLWDPGILWTHVLSDGLIALSYFSIPLALIVFIRKRKDLAFGWIFGLFASFHPFLRRFPPDADLDHVAALLLD